jgi:hypothetical protein
MRCGQDSKFDWNSLEMGYDQNRMDALPEFKLGRDSLANGMRQAYEVVTQMDATRIENLNGIFWRMDMTSIGSCSAAARIGNLNGTVWHTT